MSFSSEKHGGILVVSLADQVNSANAPEVESAFLGHLDQGETRCVLDLSRLDYISSAGLRVILMAAKRLKQNSGRLVLCGLQPNVQEVLDISGFLSFLDVVESRAAAMARFDG